MVRAGDPRRVWLDVDVVSTICRPRAFQAPLGQPQNRIFVHEIRPIASVTLWWISVGLIDSLPVLEVTESDGRSMQEADKCT